MRRETAGSVAGALLWCALCALAPAGAGDPSGTRGFDHSPIRLAGDRLVVQEGDRWRELVGVTPFCLECHGDAVAPGTPREGAARGHSIGPAASSHPVDRPYPSDKPGYVAPEALDSRLLLVEGRITCLSCHDGDAPDHRVVIPEAQAALCRACHRL